ncbi:MAG: energy transducer TonB [Candidatus Krumholzibacteriota bacterium]|nr:energy transducer TonB [Candidatus Krumholzibacteriota bacterium]
MFRYRSQRVALAVSLLIHLLILFLYRPLARIRIFPQRAETALAREMEPLVFELVETPDDAVRQRPKSSRFISDKDALARDGYQGKDKEEGEAYSEGSVPYRVFAGPSDPPAVSRDRSPKEPADVSRSGSGDPPREADRGETGDYSESRRREGPSLKLENYLLAQTGLRPPAMRRWSSDDIDYDQRRFSAEDLGGISLSTYAWDYAHYIFDMKRKLKSNTYPPGAFTLLGMISGETVLSFKVLADGTVADIKVIDYKGDRSLMETSVDAVRISSPFRPLPSDFPDEYLELKWTFIYVVYR